MRKWENMIENTLYKISTRLYIDGPRSRRRRSPASVWEGRDVPVRAASSEGPSLDPCPSLLRRRSRPPRRQSRRNRLTGPHSGAKSNEYGSGTSGEPNMIEHWRIQIGILLLLLWSKRKRDAINWIQCRQVKINRVLRGLTLLGHWSTPLEKCQNRPGGLFWTIGSQITAKHWLTFLYSKFSGEKRPPW